MTISLRNTVNIFILFFPLFILSQEIDSSAIKKIRNLSREGNYTKSYQLINSIIERIPKNKLNYMSFAYETKAGIEQNLGKYEQSLQTAKMALLISKKLKDSFSISYNYNLMGISYYYLSRYDSAKIYYEKSYDLKKKINEIDEVLAVSAYNIAIVYEDLAQPEIAFKFYKEAEFYLLKDSNPKSFLSDVYVGLSHLYFFKKDINKAEEYSEKAMDYGLKSYGEFNPSMTFVYNSYSNILITKKKYKEAISLLEKNIKIREDTYGKFHKWTCESYYKLAKVLVLDKQYNRAETFFKKAIQIGKKIKSLQYLANAEAFLARMYIEQNKNLDTAEELALSALKKNVFVFGYQNDLIVENYNILAEIAILKENEDVFFRSVSQVFNSSNYDKNDINKVIAPYGVLNTMVLMSDWYLKQYNKNQNLNILKKGFDLIDQEVALIKYSQKNFSSDKSKINFANEYRNVFEKGLHICWKLYTETKDKKYLEKAFELSESNRNATLLEGLQDIQFKLFGDIPEDLLLFEKSVRQKLELVKLDLYYEKIASNPDKDLITELLNKRILLSSRLDSLNNSFEKNYPRYKNLKYQNKIIKLSDVQKDLNKNTQLIIYFLGDESLYTFVITKEKIRFLKKDNADQIIGITDKFKTELLDRKNIDNNSKVLFSYLLKDEINYAKHNLIIIPDNKLNYIPFEVLVSEKNNFLIHSFNISYAGSVRLFLELKNDFFNYHTPQYWAGFSPIYTDDQKITSSSNEVYEISKIVKGKAFIGDESKISSFLSNNSGYSILHLAMHTEINNENPMYNKLIFSDGELSASEIYLSKNRANLAVLSSCNTGFGKLEKGEGVMSMARAFHFSGVPSIIMSLWKVPDKETKKIMLSFYKHLNKGESKSEALRNAKLDYMATVSDPYLNHPYYWSGFVLNGNTKPLKNSIFNLYLISAGGAILLVGFLLWKKKQTRV